MGLATLLARLLSGRSLERDLHDEIEFHIDMRAAAYVKDGMKPEDADALARQHFGDKEAVMRKMRFVRVTSPRAAVLAAMAVSSIAAMMWISSRSNVAFPAPAAFPMRIERRTPPPPPPPPPTWAEFVKKVNTFGDGIDRKRRR